MTVLLAKVRCNVFGKLLSKLSLSVASTYLVDDKKDPPDIRICDPKLKVSLLALIQSTLFLSTISCFYSLSSLSRSSFGRCLTTVILLVRPGGARSLAGAVCSRTTCIRCSRVLNFSENDVSRGLSIRL